MPLPIIDPIWEENPYVVAGGIWQDGGTGGRMLRYAITDLSALPATDGLSSEETRRRQWLRNLERWIAEGVDFVQIREKSLNAGELFRLAREGMHLLASSPADEHHGKPKLLINSRADIAAAARADGVHLTSRAGELTPAQARAIFLNAGLSHCLVSRSCHTPSEATAAGQSSADLVLFGPVFGKNVNGREVRGATGLDHLRIACSTATPIPVLALGSISSGNIAACLGAGAAGVAGIRLFQLAASEESDPREKIDS